MSAARGVELEPTPWPPIGGLVRVGAAASHPWLGPQGRSSRVEDVTDDGIAIAAPRGPGDIEPPREGDEFELRWTAARGLQVLPVRLVDRGRDGVTLWWCEPLGSVRLQQRRAYVRAQAVGDQPTRVVLRWTTPEEGCAEGVLVDLSEGGLRARVRGWSGGTDVPVQIGLVLPTGAAGDGPDSRGDREAGPGHELRGTALRGREPDLANAPIGVLDVSVQFEQPVPRADELRRLVFDWQRAQRRAGHG